MSLRVRYLGVALLVALPARARTQSPVEARAGYDAAIRALTTAELKGDAAAVGALIAADYSFLAPGLLASGRASNVEGLRRQFRAETFDSLAYRTSVFHSQGSLAYGAGVVHIVAHSNSNTESGTTDDRFVAIVVREPDGRWRFQYFVQVPSKVEQPK